MAKTNYKTIDEYHAAHSGEVLARMNRIRAVVKSAVPEATEIIS